MVNRKFKIKVQGRWHEIELEDNRDGTFQVTVDGEKFEVEVGLAKGNKDIEPDLAYKTTTSSSVGSKQAALVDVPDSVGPIGSVGITEGNQKMILAPMPGRIIEVLVKVSDEITKGMTLCVLETMKMEQRIQSLHVGKIRSVFISAGQNVKVGESLVELE
jgi:biotin carboxyl carrier protein